MTPWPPSGTTTKRLPATQADARCRNGDNQYGAGTCCAPMMHHCNGTQAVTLSRDPFWRNHHDPYRTCPPPGRSRPRRGPDHGRPLRAGRHARPELRPDRLLPRPALPDLRQVPDGTRAPGARVPPARRAGRGHQLRRRRPRPPDGREDQGQRREVRLRPEPEGRPPVGPVHQPLDRQDLHRPRRARPVRRARCVPGAPRRHAVLRLNPDHALCAARSSRTWSVPSTTPWARTTRRAANTPARSEPPWRTSPHCPTMRACAISSP